MAKVVIDYGNFDPYTGKIDREITTDRWRVKIGKDFAVASNQQGAMIKLAEDLHAQKLALEAGE